MGETRTRDAARRPAVQAPAAIELGPNTPAGVALRGYLGRQAAVLRDQADRLRRAEPDAAHKTRVAARRCRGVLGAFGVLVDPSWSRSLRAELRWLADQLAGERDREVVLARLLAALDGLERDWPEPDVRGSGVLGSEGQRRARRLLRARLAGELASAHDEALAALAGPRYQELAARLAAIDAELPLRPAADGSCAVVLPPLVDKAYQRLVAGVRALPTPPGRASTTGIPGQARVLMGSQLTACLATPSGSIAADDEPWHRLRILAKRARYAAEAVTPVFGPNAAAFAARMTEVTELIGLHQDASVAAGVVREVAAERGVGAATSFTLGVLWASQRAEVAQRRLEFAELWPRVSRGRWRRWLRT